MNRLGIFLIVVLLLPASYAQANVIEDLQILKTICDKGLIPEQKCKEKRNQLLQTLGSEDDSENSVKWICNYSGEDVLPASLNFQDSKSFSESAGVGEIVKELLDEAGLAPNFIVQPANVPNAAALVRGTQRFIEFNPGFVARAKDSAKTNWSIYSILAHEIGHHLQGHTLSNTGSRPAIELEADEYSGFMMAKLGATLKQAQNSMNLLGSKTGSLTHPPKNKRLDAIKKGWKKGKKKKQADDKAAISDQPEEDEPIKKVQSVPALVQYSHECNINNEQLLITVSDKVLSPARGMSQVGQKVRAMDPRCIFSIIDGIGHYCIVNSGLVYVGRPDPVGQCRTCSPGAC